MSSPHISRHVRALTIECQGHSGDDEPWLHTDTSLHLILPLLTRLTKIAVVGGAEPGSGFSKSYFTSWSSLSSNLRSALTSVLRSASVVDIEIGGFSLMPTSSVSKCSALKRLSLLPVYLVDDTGIGATHTTPSGPPDTTSAIPVQRSELEEFEIRQTSITLRRTTDWLHSPGCYLDVTRLRNLNVHVVTLEDHNSVARILETCSSSLENLSLDAGSEVNTVRHIHGTIYPASTPASSISLASLPRLRSLTLHATISMLMLNNRRFADPFPWLVAFLETLPSSNCLFELEISVEVAVGKEIFNKISWEELARVLVSERMSSLRTARLELRLKEQVLVHGLPQVLEGVLDADEHLRELRSRLILEVDIQ